MGNELYTNEKTLTTLPKRRTSFTNSIHPPLFFPEDSVRSPFPFEDRLVMASGSRSHSVENAARSDFETGNEQMEEIRKVGFQSYIDTKRKKSKDVDANVHNSFPSHTSCVCCMDERVVSQIADGVFTAGSGILLKDDPILKARFIQFCKERGVKNVHLHKSCGAVGIYREAKSAREHRVVTQEEAETDARAWAEELAAALGGQVLEELEVTPSYHNARTIYYDTTGRFNPSAATGTFPPGFVIGRPGVSEAFGRVQIFKAIEIAFGHGFNTLFTTKHPLYIVAVAYSKQAKDTAMGEINRELNSNPDLKRYKHLIKIDFFVMSEIKPDTDAETKKKMTGKPPEGRTAPVRRAGARESLLEKWRRLKQSIGFMTYDVMEGVKSFFQDIGAIINRLLYRDSHRSNDEDWEPFAAAGMVGGTTAAVMGAIALSVSVSGVATMADVAFTGGIITAVVTVGTYFFTWAVNKSQYA